MSSPHPRRPQAALRHAAQLAFDQAPHDVDQALAAFAEALAHHHHARLPRGWGDGLIRSIFQGALDRSLGDRQRAARQVATDLGLMRVFELTRPVVAQAA